MKRRRDDNDNLISLQEREGNQRVRGNFLAQTPCKKMLEKERWNMKMKKQKKISMKRK